MTSYRSTHNMHCKHDGCSNTHPASKWDAMRAERQGWFHQVNGDSWCPDHLPDWLSAWRKRKRQEQEEGQ